VAELRKPRHKWIKWVAIGLLTVLIAAAGVVEFALRRVEPFLRTRIVESLQIRFHARVELDSFHVSLVNGLWAEGKGLRIWPPSQVEGVTVPAGQGEPLIRLDEFRFHAPLRYAPGQPIHISVVELKGLSIHLPPRSHFQHPSPPAGALGVPAKSKIPIAALVRFQVEMIEVTGADLVMETNKPGKLPWEFPIARLKLTRLGADQAMTFDAELTNPRPRGTIYATGSFGPWQTVDPGESPLAGDFHLDHADLASFKGIAGILDSTGHFQGTLRNLTVDGQTVTPDFRLTHFGNPVALTTRYYAHVDGTNGDTWLDQVEATLGRSHFNVQGRIVRQPEAVVGGAQQYGGHDISLAVNVDKGRIEDFLRLTSHTGNVLLTGDFTMKTALHISPGPLPVHLRLMLNGEFQLRNALFTNAKMQKRIAELSLRGQGRPEALKTTDPATILSGMQSSFQLAGGVITLPALDFTVPGATVQFKGVYGLEGGKLDFSGAARMQAPVSKMIGGWKGLLLTPADRLLKKDGAATEVPIEIHGTREQPDFTIDLDGMKISGQR
jgi:hypothetical protein